MPGTVGFEWWIVADRFGWEGVGNANLRGCSVALDRQRSSYSGGRRGIVVGVAGRRRDDDPTLPLWIPASARITNSVAGDNYFRTNRSCRLVPAQRSEEFWG